MTRLCAFYGVSRAGYYAWQRRSESAHQVQDWALLEEIRALFGGAPPATRSRLEVKVRELLRLLQEDGWYLARTRGSHRQLHHPSKPGTVTVAGSRAVTYLPVPCAVFETGRAVGAKE